MKAPAGKGGRGKTTAAQGETTVQEEVPRLPHERDESADSQKAAEASGPAMARQAQEDVERGLVDTGKKPVIEQAYDKVRGKSESDPLDKLSP